MKWPKWLLPAALVGVAIGSGKDPLMDLQKSGGGMVVETNIGMPKADKELIEAAERLHRAKEVIQNWNNYDPRVFNEFMLLATNDAAKIIIRAQSHKLTNEDLNLMQQSYADLREVGQTLQKLHQMEEVKSTQISRSLGQVQEAKEALGRLLEHHLNTRRS